MADYTQGRVRMNEATAAEFLEAARTHVDYLLDVRDAVAPYKDARSRLNERVKAARRGIKELERVAAELGWESRDEPERP